MEDAAGLVSAESICIYPPGIPIITPGERLTHSIVDALLNARGEGIITVGHEDPNLETIQVIQT